MNDKKQLMFAATGGIADDYLAEAAAPRLIFSNHAIKRIAAVAAIIAILFTFFLWTPTTQNTTPLFAVRVFAAENSEQTVEIGNPPVPMDSVYSSSMCEHFFPDNWYHSDFSFKICKEETFPQDYFTDVVIEWDGNCLAERCLDNIAPLQGYLGGGDIGIFSMNDRTRPQDSYLCIHGWLDKTTNIKISLYVTKNDTRKLAQTITVRVNVDEAGYTLEVTGITMHKL